MLLSYAMLRADATKTADQDIDAFFRDFAQADFSLADKHLKHLTQNREEADAIIARHKDAIRNFTYSKISPPSLNVMLNRTEVGVSWDLNIVFSKQADGWYVLTLEEFTPNP